MLDRRPVGEVPVNFKFRGLSLKDVQQFGVFRLATGAAALHAFLGALPGRVVPPGGLLHSDHGAKLLPADAARSVLKLVETLHLTPRHGLRLFGGRRPAVRRRCPIVGSQLLRLGVGGLRHRCLGFWPLDRGWGAGGIFESDRVTIAASLPPDTGARPLLIGELAGLFATRGQQLIWAGPEGR